MPSKDSTKTAADALPTLWDGLEDWTEARTLDERLAAARGER